MEKPPSTPEMSAREAENMADAMLRDSSLRDAERIDEGLPQGSGSDKLLEEEDGEKLPKVGDEKQPENTPIGKFIMPCSDRVLPSLLAL